jgi:hypothetical protein
MSVNCQHSSPSGGAGEGCSPVFFWGEGGERGGARGEGMNDHSKLEARQNSISWHILVFRLHYEGIVACTMYMCCAVLCSVYSAVQTI